MTKATKIGSSSLYKSTTCTDSSTSSESLLPFCRPGILTSYTHHSPQPTGLKVNAGCVLGVDEAGRGPVLGPMVYGICYCPVVWKEELDKQGFTDSKKLTETQRDSLFEVVLKNSDMMGWGVRVMSPQDISSGMLGRNKYNLNEQARDTTVNLVREVIESGINVVEMYVDTLGSPEAHQAKLSSVFPGIRILVTKKADEKFAIVSAASICAKVTRDWVLRNWVFAERGLENFSREFGSGYPSDPNTIAWLQSNMDPVFGFPSLLRFSWATCEKLLEEAVKVTWPEEPEKGQKKIKRLLEKKPQTRAKLFVDLGLSIVDDF
ncbi:uncharacterized protein VTP21DRAFT_9011 [Calcarisporiella thermophila]|uniref:uncharacterized protein n=1 Tax=Calcarisporiella thermophila TaxID=911321 RepID=UPI0037438391